jgi:glycosyltransferase involved in cell wall biosynthesis
MYSEALADARVIVTVSHASRQDVIKFHRVPSKKIYTIHWAAPTRLIQPLSPSEVRALRNKYGLEERYVIFPSLTYGHKNHLRLIEALQVIRARRNTNISLICPGFRSHIWPQIRRQIAELDLDGLIRFPGFVPERDLLGLMRQAEFMVFPSLFEGAGLPALEAISEGVPLTCSDIPALREYVGGAALYFDAESVDSIADAIWSLYTSRELREDLRERGSEQAKRFTWDRTARQYRAIYRLLVGKTLAADEQTLLQDCQPDEERLLHSSVN